METQHLRVGDGLQYILLCGSFGLVEGRDYGEFLQVILFGKECYLLTV